MLGAKTVLVERDRLGGDCTWRGCVPSKALLHVASVAQTARTGERFGIDTGTPAVDWNRVRAWLDRVRREIYDDADSPQALGRYGIRVVAGNASFLDAARLRVIGPSVEETLTARRFVICTGSEPTPLSLDVPYVTADTVFDVPERPRRLVIAGGGPVGTECAQAFARLGTAVHLVASTGRLLPRDDSDHALALQGALETEGVRFSFGTRVVAARFANGEKVVRLSSGVELSCDEILVAAGRTPRVAGFGLEAAGVEVLDGAVVVDARCRTNVRHIFAAGDVTGPPYFTHAAEQMSKIAVANALLHLRRRYDASRVPWCTFTDPELAHAGAAESDLRARDVPFTVLAFPNDRLDRAIVDGATSGSTKLYVGRRGRILGASMLAPRAGEVIGEVALAIDAGMSVSKLAATMHPYPSYSYGSRRAADGWLAKTLTPTVRRVLRAAFRFRS
ncbi:MAG: FAD-dependent oxidoreductase [Candidatus Eremiobacteraeota bacterium]|nr:FAD-dependent oxidoreductase [Candidatus Eremiobacteraeota bacterium]